VYLVDDHHDLDLLHEDSVEHLVEASHAILDQRLVLTQLRLQLLQVDATNENI